MRDVRPHGAIETDVETPVDNQPRWIPRSPEVGELLAAHEMPRASLTLGKA